MKSFIVILFSLLLTLMPFVSMRMACLPSQVKACCHAGCPPPCCAQKNSDGSPAPIAPVSQNGAQNQISLLALMLAVYSLPEKPASSFSSNSPSPLTAIGAPLYTRHCIWLI